LDRPARNNESFSLSGLLAEIAFNLRRLSSTMKFNKKATLNGNVRYGKINVVLTFVKNFQFPFAHHNQSQLTRAMK
jgi:hypothetical protein